VSTIRYKGDEDKIGGANAREASAHQATQESAGTDADQAGVQPDTGQWKPIWDEVYDRLKEERHLFDAFQKDLIDFDNRIHLPEGTDEEADSTDGWDFQQRISAIAKDRVNIITQARLRIKFGKRQIVVGEQVSRIVQTITRFKDSIVPAVSSEPHASLAWAGILNILLVGPCETQYFHLSTDTRS
jgi:hypothetical protein